MNTNKIYWKWYDYCSFLQETGNDLSSRKTLNSVTLSSDDNSNQSHFESISAGVEDHSGPSKSFVYNEVPQPQSHQLDSTTLASPEISEMDIKSEGNYYTEEQYQLSENSGPSGHVLPRDMDGELMRIDASEKREDLDKKFLIKGVCSAVEYHLSNERITEDDVIEFHGFIVKSMHSYFKNKYK